MKILFAGGGTLGPVTPLLAVAEAWQKMDPTVSFVWVGTRSGPEREIVQKAGIAFRDIPTARLPRYPSLEWLVLPFRLLAACFLAWRILRRERPSLIASAGGYTAVPVIVMGWLCRIPSWIHQQDVSPLLSNRLCAPFAQCITTAWPSSLKDFPASKTTHLGNPIRRVLLEGKKETARALFGLDDRPTVLVVGGGTGALWMNHLMEEVGPWLVKRTNVIHITGKGKLTEPLRRIGKGYVVRELLMPEEMSQAYAVADLVVARAGMGTLTELAAWRKPSMLIPLPGSAQERNARIVADVGAAKVVSQSAMTVNNFRNVLEDLLSDKQKQRTLSERMGALLLTDVAETFARHVQRICLAPYPGSSAISDSDPAQSVH
ncbi:MAG: UDP-diphospho-muramoylpentapeptide beta-N- acetylglucosaminyltransferase [Candidatus Giovannonibacteria bacterium GW2011_GWA2_53_7]|uniref:UDP-N-acetylglucosamine--N-acetylmuramyl-(pentapeptide) pyrophosphoryl-undecaprenol N-acetylglucosamine transferase n=1 Tax=Candidatus Giovannonibacteria bacterium GW2011_GWA2_53_7 TaxID=1618650 RepID=A0A0G1Y169_9BACT|nr:MAG: UDP-diphospho-muramoylpentapeptide beta-N- acetylglucosaminyltransferase [Candidatus Giovannonibacteria bacterium GW2011_GWA2_53_7]